MRHVQQLRDVDQQDAGDQLLRDPLVHDVDDFGWVDRERAVDRNFDNEMLKFHRGWGRW